MIAAFVIGCLRKVYQDFRSERVRYETHGSISQLKSEHLGSDVSDFRAAKFIIFVVFRLKSLMFFVFNRSNSEMETSALVPPS